MLYLTAAGLGFSTFEKFSRTGNHVKEKNGIEEDLGA